MTGLGPVIFFVDVEMPASSAGMMRKRLLYEN
jgi:hypothetical protein